MALKLRYVAPIVVLVWLVGGFVVWWLNVDPETRGQFGDMFGAVNALFTGLAFAGLLVTLRTQQHQLELQRTELALQRDELKLQREEMKGSRAELANQVATQKAMVRAAVAQVAVAAAQAKIEAIKVRGGEGIGNHKEDAAAQIDAVGGSLAALSDMVENECKSLMKPDGKA